MKGSYVKVAQEVERGVAGNEVRHITSLIESVTSLVSNSPLDTIIKEISFSMPTPDKVDVTLDIFPQHRSLMFGRKFTNVSCLRKLVSNLSGRTGLYFYLDVIE